jgi:hypothetical protein
MKELRVSFGLLLVLLLTSAWTSNAFAQASRFDELANLPFSENRPTVQTAQTLRDELFFQRATQTYLWAMPLLNTLGMKLGSEKVFGAGYNVLPIWKKRLDAKTLVTTPNSDVIYAMSYVDLGKDGPLVFEAPPQLQGILLDFWQHPIPVDGGNSLETLVSSVPMQVRAASSCSCLRDTTGPCHRAILFTGPKQTMYSSFCALSIKTRRILLLL